MLKKTLYSKNNEFQILFTVPHGAGHENFFSRHPKLFQSLVASFDQSLLESYLEIERDFASSDLAHASAKRIFENGGNYGVLVLEPDYPRGILDGGRQPSHCLRAVLSQDLQSSYARELLAVHNDCLGEIRRQLVKVNAANGIVIDLHTMASFAPRHAPPLGDSRTELETYVKAYLDAGCDFKSLKRKIDIISRDGDGNLLAAPQLREIFVSGFSAIFDISENEPYAALDPYLMNELMRKTKGLAIDFPKDCLSIQGADSSLLASLQLCQKKTNHIAEVISRLVFQFFSLRLPLSDAESKDLASTR